MTRLYLMPMTVQNTPLGDVLMPKYQTTFAGTAWSKLDYGHYPVTLIASDTTDGVHTALTANADVLAFPDNWANTVSGATRTNLQNRLESLGVPATWITNGMTYLEVLHTVGAMFAFIQRVEVLAGRDKPLGDPVNLNLQVGNLTNPSAFQETALSFGWSISGISVTTTIRNALKYMADQWGTAPLVIGPFTF